MWGGATGGQGEGGESSVGSAPHLVGCGDGLVGCEKGDDLLAGGIAVDKVLLQLAQRRQRVLVYLRVHLAGKLHVRAQPR